MRWLLAACLVMVGGAAEANVGDIQCGQYLNILTSGALADRQRVGDYLDGYMAGAGRHDQKGIDALMHETAILCRKHPDYTLALALAGASAVLAATGD